jgi:predicted 3-demethylubiquinone-9 3-methyltransferase (glyoxalase superfamily)
MMDDKIFSSLWFDDNAQEVMEFYTSVFLVLADTRVFKLGVVGLIYGPEKQRTANIDLDRMRDIGL